MLYPFLKIFASLCLVHGNSQDFLNVLEGVLVHVVDEGKVFDDEEQNRSSGGHSAVLLSHFGNVLLYLFALDHLGLYLSCCLL